MKSIPTKSLRTGAAATELAMVLPLLVVFCLAALDLGRYAHQAIALESAVRIGAEYGASRRVTSYSQSTWEDRIEQYVEEEMANGGEDPPETLSVTVTPSDLAADPVEVDVSAEYTFSTLVNWVVFPRDLVIRRNITVERFR